MVVPGYNGQGTVNFATLRQSLTTRKYNWDRYERQACCYELRHGHAIAFEIRMPRPSNPNYRASMQWFDFLTGKRSPWQSVLQDSEVLFDGGVPCGIIVKDCRVSRALLHNFFLALRCIWEYRMDVKMFGRLVDLGVPPQAAIYYAWTTATNGEYVSSWRCNGHTWMHSPYTNHPLMSRLFNLPSWVVPSELFTESAEHLEGEFIHSNHVWHEYPAVQNPGEHLTPPCLDEFPSVKLSPPSVYNPKLEPQREVHIPAFYDEVVSVYKTRLAKEKEVAAHLI